MANVLRKALISAKANVNALDADSWTALMFAVWMGYADTVKVLLDAGADVNAQDNNGETALSLAEQNGHTAVADMLRNAGVR